MFLVGRPIAAVDGTRLHTFFKHNMLTLSCLDAFNNIIIFGYCICSAESDENYDISLNL